MNKKILSFLCVCCSLSAQTKQEYQEYIQLEEGKRNYVYRDIFGNKTIGIGHKLKNGENFHYIDDNVVNSLFAVDFEIAKSDAQKLISNFNEHPKEIKITIVSMTYNLGYNRFFGFKKFRAAIEMKDYNAAAFEILNSKWAKQLPQRAHRTVKILKKYSHE